MGRITDASPDPSTHIKTLMRIGYTMSSAIADIIDNAITANASNIQILSPPGLEQPSISLVDNGYGMSLCELIENMRIGCKDPSIERESGDLGRFGSGMKTASFSQARRLTVFTKKIDEHICAAVWDIDRVQKEKNWSLEILDANEIKEHPLLFLEPKQEQGTQILWENLSCLTTDSHSLDADSIIASKLADLDNYLSLHFHKFMEGKYKRIISINGRKLDPIDPFLSNCDGYQEGRSEKLRCKGGYIEINTHVLPHIGRIKSSIIDRLGGSTGLVQNQGLYIYREQRMINAGGWLGLEKNSQLGALARVEVNIPSSLDHEWSTDVKKASLQLPPRIKRELRKFLADPIKRSKRVYIYRGKSDKANRYWDINENENNKTVSYQISGLNEDLNNLIESLTTSQKNQLLQYLGQLAENLPLHHIYQKMSESPRDIDQQSVSDELIASIMAKYMEN